MATPSGCENIDLLSSQPASGVQCGSSPTQPPSPLLPHHPLLTSAPPEQLQSVDALHNVISSVCATSAVSTGSSFPNSYDESVSTLLHTPPTVPDFLSTSAVDRRDGREKEKGRREGESASLNLDLDRVPSVDRRNLNLGALSKSCNTRQKTAYREHSGDYPSPISDQDQRRLHLGLSKRWSSVDYSDLSFEDCSSWRPRQDSTDNYCKVNSESQSQFHSSPVSSLKRGLQCSVSADSDLWFVNTFPTFPLNWTHLAGLYHTSSKGSDPVLERFSSTDCISENLRQRSVSLPNLKHEDCSILNPFYEWTTFISYLSLCKRQADQNINDKLVDERDFVSEERPKLKRFPAFSSFNESITEEEDYSINHEPPHSSPTLQGDYQECNFDEDAFLAEDNDWLNTLDTKLPNHPLEYMNNNPKNYELFGTLRSDAVVELRPILREMKRSSSEGRTRARARFSSDVESVGYSDKRLSDSEGSDTHSQTHRGRTSNEKKFRSNGTRSKKTDATPTAGNSAVPVWQRPTKMKQPKQPEGQGTPATQRKTQQRRILPSVGVTQQKAFTKDVNGVAPGKIVNIRRPPYSRSQTLPSSDRKAGASLRTTEKGSELAQTKPVQTPETVANNPGGEDANAVSKETTQRRSILRVMRRPTEVSDAQIFTMKPSDVRLNNGVWSEARQVETENENAEEEMVAPSVNNQDSASPSVSTRLSIISKPQIDEGDDQREDANGVEALMASEMSYSVESQPDSVTTSAVIHLTNNSISSGEGDSVDNTMNNDMNPNSIITNGITATPNNQYLDNSNIQDEMNHINGNNNNNDANQPDANSLEISQELPAATSSPSKSNSEPLLNTEETPDLDRSGSSYRRPKETTKSKFSASEDHLSSIPRPTRIPKSAPTTPAQGHAPVFPKSPAGSDGNSSGGGSTASSSLPPGAPWSKETWTSRKRYEMAHCDHDHFMTSLSSLNQYARDLRLEKSKGGLKNHAHDHAQCYHSDGSQETEHFRTDHHCIRDHGKCDHSVPGPYLTPRQRLEKETRMLRREVSKLLRENEQKEAEVFALQCQVDGEKKIQDSEKDEQIVQLTEKLGRNEKERFLDKEALSKAQEEISDLNYKYEELERQMMEQKAKYDEYLLGMYRKGQEAARFEREQELDYLLANAKNAKKAGVSLTELSRKLFQTEGELARWQALRLSESYNSPKTDNSQSQLLKIRNNHHSLLDPTAASDADVTLAFVRDGFFHLLTDPIDREQHIRALLKIFAYPEGHLDRIKTGLADFKNIKMKKVFVDAK